jgi:hypothetical protein
MSCSFDFCVEIELLLVNQIRWAWPSERKCLVGLPANCNEHMRGDESFADDLNGNGVL